MTISSSTNPLDVRKTDLEQLLIPTSYTDAKNLVEMDEHIMNIWSYGRILLAAGAGFAASMVAQHHYKNIYTSAAIGLFTGAAIEAVLDSIVSCSSLDKYGNTTEFAINPKIYMANVYQRMIIDDPVSESGPK